jgi:WhiB family transcriptional regulator, redox-sensing transcriptional regulator
MYQEHRAGSRWSRGSNAAVGLPTANEEEAMHADVVGIAPGAATRRGQEERPAGARLLAHAPRAARPRPAYARVTGPSRLWPTADPADLPCRHDPELFFAEAPADVQLAKELCGLCPARQACLAGALERGEPFGVWGGELFLRGVVIAEKRPRGRPPKSAPAA